MKDKLRNESEAWRYLARLDSPDHTWYDEQVASMIRAKRIREQARAAIAQTKGKRNPWWKFWK
jgi:hypothetical protein